MKNLEKYEKYEKTHPTKKSEHVKRGSRHSQKQKMNYLVKDTNVLTIRKI